MIVNPAYIHMGEKAPAVNPNVWEVGKVNYPYGASANVEFQSSQGKFIARGVGQAITFTLPLKEFTKLTINAVGVAGDIHFSVQVFGDASTVKNSPTILNTPVNFVYNIPAAYQKDDVRITLRVINGTAQFNSMVMS